MKPIELLLERYWIVKEQDEDTYNKIKTELEDNTQSFIKEKLGYKIIANPYLIKLEKIPGIPQSFMGIQEFTSKLEYLFLCMILIYLESKSRKDQFILSQLIDYIQNLQTEIDLKDVTIDFNLYSHRKAMVKVLKYIQELGFIKRYDGDENRFADSIENDVLYEITGISKYFVRNFTSNITDCNLYSDIYEKEQLGLEQDKGIERRQRVYRRLFTENVVYPESKEDLDYLYIKNYKNIIEQDVDKILDASLEVHKDGSYILLLDNQNFRNTFPNNKAISDVVLLVNTTIICKMQEKTEEIFLSELEFTKLIEETKDSYQNGFSKEFREKDIQELQQEVIKFMQEFDMIRYHEEKRQYQIMPVVFKIKGKYPEEFEKKGEEDAGK
ncbi:MAG: TIGR02678 family protein [Clostridia bacterium]|jgi:uncharacterized protein (TIGR02678 family)|nr:TIGR02678 family protein [Clostridia bacterium]MCI9413466.1 TIGR02678 family protein [Clostridia bacterium]